MPQQENINMNTEHATQSEGGVLKGKRKVKKQRNYIDEKGYFVTEDYTDFEEYEIDPNEKI